MKTTNKYYPAVGLLRQKTHPEQYQQQYFFSWYIHRYRDYKLKYLHRWFLYIWSYTDEGLGIYPTWKNLCPFFPPWMGQPQYFDQNNQ